MADLSYQLYQQNPDSINQFFNGENAVLVNSVSDFPAPVNNKIRLDSTKTYILGSVIDMTNTGYQFEVSSSGAYIRGYNFDLSGIICTDDNYTMFVSEVGGSGNILMTDIYLQTSGTSSKVFDLTDATGFNAIEMNRVNFIACSSLGEITDYRQGLESGTGRFGGNPSLTLSGSWNGYRATTSIVRSTTLTEPLFKTGTSLTFSGRFLTDLNVDLGPTQPFFDFSAANFTTDEAFIIKGASVFRDGVINSNDTTIYPNIDESSVRCNWKDNVGIPNTQKYLNATITTEVATVIGAPLIYYPLAGTYTLNTASHFSMPANGEFELLSGNGKYFFSGNFEIDGPSNDVISIRVTKSTDGGATYPTEINHIIRQINNLSGGRDVAFVPLSFIGELGVGDRVRLEVENYTSSGNLTALLDSFFIITEV